LLKAQDCLRLRLPEHVVPGITQLLAELDEELARLELTCSPLGAAVEPLDRLVERLTWSWGIVGHLMGVKNSPELREAHETVQPLVVQFFNKLNQSQPLYKAFKALRASDTWASLSQPNSGLWKQPLKMPSFPV